MKSMWMCFLFFSLLSSSSEAVFRVVIDPGHGGSDLGASRDSFIESEIVLQIAEKVKTQIELQSANDPVEQKMEVHLTRTRNEHLSLQQRVQLANQLKADLFLSLHANWSRSKQVSGLELYFSAPTVSQNTNSRPTPALRSRDQVIEKIKNDLVLFGRQKLSLEFSEQTQKQTHLLAEDQKSVIRRAPFYVIENTTMPAVLIEVGFISNRREAQKLSTPEYQTKVASLLTQSILSYKEKSDKKLSVNEK